MKVSHPILDSLRKKDLFTLCLYGSFALHLGIAGSYYIATRTVDMYDSEEILTFKEIDVEMEDIPPELIGGTSSPAPVEKEEWVEGKNKEGKDPENNEDINPNKLSGSGTDKDGYLYSYFGDKPPTPIIDFDLKKFYPQEAKAAGISNKTVIVLVQVDEKGVLISGKIVSGHAGYGFDEAAMRIIRLLRFSPGYVKGKPVRMSHRMPIVFTLEE
jgi:protein TonB